MKFLEIIVNQLQTDPLPDLGDVISIPAASGQRISLVAKRAVIFRGVVLR